MTWFERFFLCRHIIAVAVILLVYTIWSHQFDSALLDWGQLLSLLKNISGIEAVSAVRSPGRWLSTLLSLLLGRLFARLVFVSFSIHGYRTPIFMSRRWTSRQQNPVTQKTTSPLRQFVCVSLKLPLTLGFVNCQHYWLLVFKVLTIYKRINFTCFLPLQ